MVDGTEIGTRRVTGGPFQYALDTSTLSDGQHTLQIWAHDTANETLLSDAVAVTVANTSASVQPPAAPAPTPTPAPAPAPTPTPTPTPTPVQSSPVTLTYPLSGQGVSGTISVSALVSASLDSAGSFLLVDGVEVGTRRITGAPFVYELDTTGLSAGPHVLQIWAHDTGNNTLLSNQASVTVSR